MQIFANVLYFCEIEEFNQMMRDTCFEKFLPLLSGSSRQKILIYPTIPSIQASAIHVRYVCHSWQIVWCCRNGCRALLRIH
jgi:hypothetical protein